MPYMPRPDKKAEKIAWKQLGKPENIAVKETPREKAINKRLDYQIIVDGR
jgi:hypothetical protein